MGRRTLHKPQFKERRGNGVQAQVFALRRALSIKAQLVKNQQRQIDLLGRELANACIRIAALEQRWSRDEAVWDQIGDLAVARARAAGASVDQATADALSTGAGAIALAIEQMDLAPPSDGVFDERLHSEGSGADFGAALARYHRTVNEWVNQQRSRQGTAVRLARETREKTHFQGPAHWLRTLRTRLAQRLGRLALRLHLRGQGERL